MSVLSKTQSEPVPLATAGPTADDRVLPQGVPWQLLPPEIPRALHRLCAERDAGEVEISTRYSSRVQAAESAFAQESAAIHERHQSGTTAARAKADEAIRSARQLHETDSRRIEAERVQARRSLLARAKQKLEKAEARHEQTRWETLALFEAAERGEQQRDEQYRTALEAEEAILAMRQEESGRLLAQYRRLAPALVPNSSVSEAATDPLDLLRQALNDAEDALSRLARLRSPRLVSGADAVWLFLIPAMLLIGPALYWLRPWTLAVTASVLGTLGVAIGLWVWLTSVAKRALATHVPPLLERLAVASKLCDQTRECGKRMHERLSRELHEKRDAELEACELALAVAKAEGQELRTTGLAELEQAARTRAEQCDALCKKQVRNAELERDRLLGEFDARFRAESLNIAEQRTRRLSEANSRRDRDWSNLVSRWESGMAEIGVAVDWIRKETGDRFSDWQQGASGWTSPAEVPPAVRFGELSIDLARIPHGPPRDAELKARTPERFTLPSLLTFPDRASLLVRAAGLGRDAGISVLQGTMLRFLTGLPPGKVRFTILDPIGLGRHFAAFMHLADYSELLVNSRIWTEPQQIEQRLADLSLHMENVIQQFLRNEFANLEEYNRQAAEVAEPYRVLVVAHFPAHFNDASAQRLLSIAQGGQRCGVHTLMLVDEEQPLPSTVKIEDFEAHSAVLAWNRDRFEWRDRDFAPFPLTLDVPPPDDVLTPLLHAVGAAARAASRVEVPFEVIAPPRSAWWTSEARQGIDVPMGRAGATKLQGLKLGRGTSQHVLIAGRTGSGKSTLLHALITNAALMYSPDEVEFYLIDFKKGVEFQTYAEYELPHARVIAIESEREFGISVLQRLDEELKRRGESFRLLGVQDLPGYRGVPNAPPLPRILLIVDEFQEFFVEDDKLAQDAALLLDRLVRQGRAFGIHVHLGSQTLGGAYSLARTTLGQMAVRIALQCSEADAHLILSEDNAAARLLSRPGEAIYNDANGLVEGNHVFQVVWLSEERREHYLKQIQDLARAPGAPARREQIVFEGNVLSDLGKNSRLRDLLTAESSPEPPKAAVAWLGEAVAIKDPTAATFRRQGGNHLLVIGQDAPAARGVFSAALLSVAAQFPTEHARFFLLDGTPEDDHDRDALRTVFSFVPHGVRSGGIRDSAALLDELAADLKTRLEGQSGAPSVFLFLFDLSRFRDLRKSDDDFGFSRRDDERVSPAQQLSELIREGPALGIHVIAWFDTLNNLQRVLDRGAMREFETRVLFQMSANDSSTLVDSPLANRLGAHRALYSSEEQGTLEKFRPYRMPEPAWLADVQRKLAARQ